MDGLRESLRLLSLAEEEHQSGAGGFWKFVASDTAGENELALQRVREEIEKRRRALAALEEAEATRRAEREEAERKRKEAEARRKYEEYVASARRNLAAENPGAAFVDIAHAEEIIAQNDELAELNKQLRAAFQRDPSKIITEGQARWFYTVRRFPHIFANGVFKGDVFEGIFWISQRFDRHLYRAMYASRERGVEVVIETAESLPHGGPHPFIEAMVRVKEEQVFQRAFGTTVVLPVVEILFRSR